MAKEAYIVQEADRVPLELSENVDVGDILPIGADMVGIAATSGIAGETITVYVGGVVVEAQAADADGIAVGDKLYFDATNRVLTKDSASGSNSFAGHAVTAKAANTAGSVQFLLNR